MQQYEYLQSRCGFIQYRTYVSYRTVGALISRSQMIKLDLHTGILFSCPQKARKSQIISLSNLVLHGNI